MAEDAIPLWKRHLAKAQTPEAREKATSTRRAHKNAIKALLAAAELHGNRIRDDDVLGLEAYFLDFMRGSDTKQIAALQAITRTFPQEVKGSVDTTLHVKIVKQVGDREIEIQGHGITAHPRDVATGRPLPVAPPRDHGPGNPMPEIIAEVEDA